VCGRNDFYNIHTKSFHMKHDFLSKTHLPTSKTHNDMKSRYENKWIIYSF
jgi:hypothetical protein